MRGYKGIKLLLAICPSSHRGEDLHTGLLVTSTALGFLHVQLPLCKLSLSWASAVLGLRLMGAEPRLLQLGYLRIMATGVSGECVISSVLSCCSKYLKWQTSVTA